MCCQECLRRLQIGGVKSLGKPAIDVGQYALSVIPFALLLPEPTQAHGSTQLQRPGVLLLCDGQGPMKMRFCLGRCFKPVDLLPSRSRENHQHE